VVARDAATVVGPHDVGGGRGQRVDRGAELVDDPARRTAPHLPLLAEGGGRVTVPRGQQALDRRLGGPPARVEV
jgi:hypothetical protein